jgi:hypothetical protein
MESEVRCARCEAIFPVQVTPVYEFNRRVSEEVQQKESAA